MGSGSRQGAEYVMSAIVNNSALRVAAPKKSGPKETMSAETIFPQTRILPYPVQPRNGLKGALPAMGPDVKICENSYKNRKPNTNKKKKKKGKSQNTELQLSLSQSCYEERTRTQWRGTHSRDGIY